MSAAWWLDLGVGFGIGALIMTVIFGLAFLAGWIEIRDAMYTEFISAPFAIAFIGQLGRYAAGSLLRRADVSKLPATLL